MCLWRAVRWSDLPNTFHRLSDFGSIVIVELLGKSTKQEQSEANYRLSSCKQKQKHSIRRSIPTHNLPESYPITKEEAFTRQTNDISWRRGQPKQTGATEKTRGRAEVSTTRSLRSQQQKKKKKWATSSYRVGQKTIKQEFIQRRCYTRCQQTLFYLIENQIADKIFVKITKL